jgi:hypothetical protein
MNSENREVSILNDNELYEINGETYSLHELEGFIESAQELGRKTERQTTFINALKLNNAKLTQERNDLCKKLDVKSQELAEEKRKFNEFYEKDYMVRIEECNKLWGELFDIKHMSMWEFAAKYCNDDELEKAGRQLAHELITARNNMTDEDLAISAAENCHVPYSGDDF